MEYKITAPSVNVNDEFVTLMEWTRKNGEFVKKGEIIFIIETTKATVEVESDFDGYLFYLDNLVGSKIKVGNLMALISDNKNIDFGTYFKENLEVNQEKKTDSSNEIKWTLKAEKLAEKNGISKAEVESQNIKEQIINEAIVNVFISKLQKSESNQDSKINRNNISVSELSDSRYQIGRQERVLVLGGGGGCILAIDIVSRNSNQRIVGILDNNKDLHHKTIMGIPVLGGFELIESLWNDGFFDGAISTIVKDPNERANIFNENISKGINFTNIISESVNIRLNVDMGVGNLIISGAYFAPCVKIGNNNFFAASANVEHHSVIGNNCLFGPRFTASGAVTIEDNCKFGMGVLVEPYVRIGSNCLVASGCVITNHINENSIVKNSSLVKVVGKGI